MIELQNVCKNYDTFKALDNVSFKIEPHEIVGFLGPNGAGKTTTLKIITSYLAQSSGIAKVGGYDVMEDSLKVKELIGYLPEHPVLYLDMPVYDYIYFVGLARNLKGKKLMERLDWVIEKCGLEKVIYKKINQLSKGYQQRVGLAQALIHDPPILILDEPTTGLDPIQIIGIRNLIKEMAKEKTIIFSTHILQEITLTCDRVIVIHDGKIKADGPLSQLLDEVPSKNELILTLKETPENAVNIIEKVNGVKSCVVKEKQKNEITYKITGENDAKLEDSINTAIVENNWKLRQIYEEKASLEDAFIYLTQQVSKGGEK